MKHKRILFRFSNFSPRKAAGEARTQVSRERQDVSVIVVMIIVMKDHCDDGDDYDNNYSDGVDVGREGHDLDDYYNDESRMQIIIIEST